MNKPIIFSIIVIAGLLLSCSTNQKESTFEEPLSHWNNTPLKQEIIDFVQNVSTPNSPDFVAEEDRVAVFDNDGTLWTEKPLYIPLEYEVDYLKEEVPKNPELQKSSLYSELADGNLSVLEEFTSFDLINGLFSAHKGQKEEDYEKSVYQFLTENIQSLNDKQFKPANIGLHIGKKPIFAN